MAQLSKSPSCHGHTLNQKQKMYIITSWLAANLARLHVRMKWRERGNCSRCKIQRCNVCKPHRFLLCVTELVFREMSTAYGCFFVEHSTTANQKHNPLFLQFHLCWKSKRLHIMLSRRCALWDHTNMHNSGQ